MRAVRGRDTSPEMTLRCSLHRQGLRGYRVAPRRIRGVPDLAYIGLRLAIFVDGCYWHGCPQHCRRPSSNTEYWHTKIARNVERDQRTTQELRTNGWVVLRLWEHEIMPEPRVAVERIAAQLQKLRRARSSLYLNPAAGRFNDGD